MDVAIDNLRKSGAASAAKKATREAREGVIAQYIAPGGKVRRARGSELRNRFRGAQRRLPRFLRRDRQENLRMTRTSILKPTAKRPSPRWARTSRSPAMRGWKFPATDSLRRTSTPARKIGVLVEVGAGKAETMSKEEFKQLVKDITLQIAAGFPHAVSREQVAPEVVAKEREIAAQSDRLKGKPARGDGKNPRWRAGQILSRPIASWTRAS